MGELKRKPSHGKMLCDFVFQFYQPKVPVQLEVVFVHGLERDNCGDAYWKTWLARDGTLDNVWPMTWLPHEFSSAKIFALKYDASTKQTPTHRRMDLFIVGEMLVQEMVRCGIGQNGVPVVFACHGFGGLVAKQIVRNAKHHFSQDLKAQSLLTNIGGYLFYSTPHHGSCLAKYFSYFSSFGASGKGPLLKNLEVLSVDTARLNQQFWQVAKGRSWYFASAAETHVTNYLVKWWWKKDLQDLKEVLDRYVGQLAPQEESLVPDSIVRLEAQEKVVKMKLQEVSIVGLVGMGGIGKTMLAKAVYQSICKDFPKSCYLDDIKSKISLDEVLITLLQNFGIKDKKTGAIVERSALQDCKKSLLEDLKTYVKNHKILVVMDDVGSKENLACLLGDMGFLNGNKESKIIVTCREWQVLKDHVQGSGGYEVEPMSFGQDIELFCYHAFQGVRTLEKRHQSLLDYLSKYSSQHLIDDFESMCDEVVKACGGLPLSLEVMGGCIRGYLADIRLSSEDSFDCCRGALEKLQRAEPLEGVVVNDRLWNVLEISYNCLYENEQNMFLDIACFFCDSLPYGEQTLVRIWGGGYCKKVELRNLKERCLIKINEDDESVTMHDQLRDMGRNIVRRQGEGQMTRLWDFKDVRHLLQSTEIIAPWIQGLSLEEWSTMPRTTMEAQSSGASKRRKIDKGKGFGLDCRWMRLLNLHRVEKDVIEAISIKGSSCIRWLCLKRTNISELLTFIRVCDELCVLDMRDCWFMKTLDESIGNLVNLQELNISMCMKLVSLPESLGNMVKLTTLDVSACKGLLCLPNSIQKLVRLSRLSLKNCGRLTSLPKSIGMLVNLSTLDISDCEGLTSLPKSIGKLVNLSKLDIHGCEGLTSLPKSIGKLCKLSILDISGCKGLRSLPNFFDKLVELSKLFLKDCEHLTSLPNSIGMLGNLSTLDISSCKGLTSLPDFFGNLMKLSELSLRHCERLISLPNSIGKLGNLSTLYISDCEGLISLPDSIGKLGKLSDLDISYCKGLTNLPDFTSMLVNLSTLNISGCKGLTSLPKSIDKLGNLSDLDSSGCKGLTSLPDSIGMLSNLSTFNISKCKGLNNLPDSIGKLGKLSKLDISNCKGLTSLPHSMGKLVNLDVLLMLDCEGFTSLPNFIGKLVHLSTFSISGCEGLTSLPNSIGKLGNLLDLDISGCKGLTSLPDSIGMLSNLSTFNISNCEGFKSLPDSIGKLGKLPNLDISGCEGLTSLPHSIGKLVNLSVLEIFDCKGLTSLPNSLVNLSKLNISRCHGLTSLPDSIGTCIKLKVLILGYCGRLTSLPDSIGMLSNLSTFIIFNCKGLKSLPNSIGKLGKLSDLEISDCKGLTSLPKSIGKLGNLSTLDISGCKGLTSLPDSIGKLVNLSILEIFDCKGLTSLPKSIGKLCKLSILGIPSCKGLKV